MDGEPGTEITERVVMTSPDADDIAFLVEEYGVSTQSARRLLEAGIPLDDAEYLLELRDATATEVNPRHGEAPRARDGRPALDKASIATLISLWNAAGRDVHIAEEIMEGATTIISHRTGIYRHLGQRNGVVRDLLEQQHLVDQYRSGEEPDDSELTRLAVASEADTYE